ncbi:MAG: hypothetical protein OEM29_00250 [Thermoplasmata archaeon]|nr:hypothetical protein [Thermoplasmata archaeon]
MARLPGYSMGSVLLTFIAVFFVMGSFWMSWYYISNGHIIVSEYYLNHFDPLYGTAESYRDWNPVGEVMEMLKFFAVLWFLASLHYAYWVMSDTKGSAIRDIASGMAPVTIGVGMLVYFTLAFPSAAPSQYVSGFFSSTTDGDVVYTGGPGGGFYLCAIACILQASAVLLHSKAVSSRARPLELEPYEAPVVNK